MAQPNRQADQIPRAVALETLRHEPLVIPISTSKKGYVISLFCRDSPSSKSSNRKRSGLQTSLQSWITVFRATKRAQSSCSRLRKSSLFTMVAVSYKMLTILTSSTMPYHLTVPMTAPTVIFRMYSSANQVCCKFGRLLRRYQLRTESSIKRLPLYLCISYDMTCWHLSL